MKLNLKSIVKSRSEVGSQLISPGDSVLVVRSQPRWLLLKCPCGCGEEIPVNLDLRAGKAWRIYNNDIEQLTLFPSVWRDTGCLSHFIIRRSRILLLGLSEGFSFKFQTSPGFYSLVSRVRDSWPSDEWVHYVEIAETLDEIPWDILDACLLLVRRGEFIEGRDRLRSSFRRK